MFSLRLFLLEVVIVLVVLLGFDTLMAIKALSSPVTSKLIRGVRFFIKRDDLRVTEAGLNGNKGRKLSWLARKARTPQFPSKLVTFGGTQSNALGAISTLVAYHNEGANTEDHAELTYFVKGEVPAWLKENPVSNFKIAVSSGAKIQSLDPASYTKLMDEQYGVSAGVPPSIQSFFRPSFNEDDALFLPQGGAMACSREDIEGLAEEVERDIQDIIQREGEEDEKLTSRPWLFLVASGTGTVAHFSDLFLKKSNNNRVQICTIPCVGSPEYLLEQISHLKKTPEEVDSSQIRILSAKDGCDVPFATPTQELLQIWNEISSDGCVFDLIYAPPAFRVIFQHLEELSTEYNLMWYHCGGAEGNVAMMSRYRRMGYML